MSDCRYPDGTCKECHAVKGWHRWHCNADGGADAVRAFERRAADKRGTKAMTKHSPGPWTITDNSPPRVVGPGSVYVATVEGASSNPTVMADARLIAAAPEMLELLRECAKHEIHCDPLLQSMLDLLARIDGEP